MDAVRVIIPVLAALLLAAPAQATPVLGSEVPAGGGTVLRMPDRRAPARIVDGRTRDWPGALPAFAGARKYARGTLVYRDHITDAYGPDNGQDAARLGVLDPATEAEPELFRLDPAYQYVPGEFGVPTGPLDPRVHYGDLPHVDAADLSEVRLGTDARRDLWLLARTTTMKDAGTALLVLLDTAPGKTARPVPYNSGLTSSKADVAVFLAGSHGSWTDLASGATHAFGSVATNPAGYTNAIEARIPAAALGGRRDRVGVAVATGLADNGKLKTLDLQPNVANVAFRTSEPARDWWDKRQGLDLYQGTADAFFTTADLARMAAGASERYVAGPGYHDRIFRSDPRISAEKGDEGVLQHYGVYLPDGYRAGKPSPVQWWFHFRGGNAHIAAAVVPGIFRDMGAAHNSVVVTPDGRGESGWYVGRSHLDYREVYRDVHRLLTLDRNREYIAGHSMGGWASYLLPVLYPDRFAASFPASGPPTQGAWLGCEGDPCYMEANGGDARAELTTPLLANLRNVPVVAFHGSEDELVPVSGPIAQTNRLRDLGLRYRLYLFEHQEHYGPPIQDEWTEGAAYEHGFVRDRNPGRVTYSRSMRFEHAVNTVNNEQKVAFGFRFDHAYWMSGLRPVDRKAGVASFDGTTLARPEAPHTLVPEAGGPSALGQSGPYTMVGQRWEDGAKPKPRNRFRVTLTGARAVTLNLRRMGLTRRARGTVTTDGPLRLRIGHRVIRVPKGTTKLNLARRSPSST
jgi:dienelactone hydrolase